MAGRAVRIRVDPAGLDRIANEWETLRDRFDELNGWDRENVPCLGHSDVTSAFAGFVRNWDGKRNKINKMLEEAAAAARDAARAYREADGAIRDMARDARSGS